MKNRIKNTLFILALIGIITTIGVTANSNNNRQSEWYNTRVIKTITVQRGDTLNGIGYEYKPSWMDVREYSYLVMQLNDLDSAFIYAGDKLDIYVCAEHYTMQGLCTEEFIVTVDGNEWIYDTDIRGCVNITFSDNGTDRDVTDDVIMNIEYIGG